MHPFQRVNRKLYTNASGKNRLYKQLKLSITEKDAAGFTG